MLRSFQAVLSSTFADKDGGPKAWTAVCNEPQKQEITTREGLVVAATENSPDNTCSHQMSLEDLSPLGKRILLYMSEKSPARVLSGRSLCECDLDKRVGSVGTIGEGFPSIFVGVCSQTRAKEISHLTRRLMDGEWMQRSLHHVAFARVGGEPGLMLLPSSRPEMDFVEMQHREESMPWILSAPQHLLWKLFGQTMQGWRLHYQEHQICPDKETLMSVQDFFNYTEFEGKKVFEELDQDADGKLTLDDLRMAMRKMRLPVGYAKDFMRRKRWLWPWPAKDYDWPEFSSLLQEKEPMILQLFNSLGVSKSGTVNRSHVKDLLVNAGLFASEDNIMAMMRFLAEDASDGLKYGQFRKFMLLLPTEQLVQDPWSVWLKAATTQDMEHLREDWRLPLLNNMFWAHRNMQNEDLAKGQIPQFIE